MRHNLALPLALLFIALGVPSNAQKAGDEERLVTVEEGAPLLVECALRVEERAEWRLDGGALPADLREAGEAAAPHGLTARLAAAAARRAHAGVYTCARRASARVRVVVRAAPAPDAGEPTAAEPSAAAPAPQPVSGLNLFYYDVGRSFLINCSAPRPADGSAYVWKKNGTAIEDTWDLRDRYVLDNGGATFRMVSRTTEEDFGNYSCAIGGDAPAQLWDVRGRPFAKLPHNTNVVEKQPLKLTCKLVGKPYPAVTWTFKNATQNGSDVTDVLGDRVKLKRSEQGVEDGELVVESAERSDAGEYTCQPAGGAATAATTTLRVKDQYAALWPFLGICAEVFVLCAIILVYEKRRTKPELDDSDTDNHDQKKS